MEICLDSKEKSEKAMETHSRTLVWKSCMTEEPWEAMNHGDTELKQEFVSPTFDFSLS